MAHRILLFTQSGCLNCEVMKIFLEAKELVFEERNMSNDPSARAELFDTYHGSYHSDAGDSHRIGRRGDRRLRSRPP